MELQTFIRKNRPVWSELEQLAEPFERKRPVDASQIDRLIELYRKTSAHLAYAQTYYPHDEIRVYLNDLVSRSHHAVYAEQWKSTHRIAEFFKKTFVRIVVERRWFVLVAMALFIIGGLSGFAAVSSDPLNLYLVIPEQIAGSVDPDRIGENDHWAHSIMSAEIMTNNIRVAALAFAGGITFGVLTAWMMLYNGLLVGALFAVFWQSGNSYVFWAYILPHGIIELVAIFVAGGAGLFMGYRMIVPGRFTRKYQFLRSVRESAMLLVGTVPLFVIAGLIEGYVTPAAIPLWSKYVFALATLAALIVYFMYGLKSRAAGVVTGRGHPTYITSRDLMSR